MSTPSLHLVCIAENLSFIRTSWRAWQSVSTSTGYPYTISEDLSKEYFNAVNSSKKSLYFSSETEVCFDAKVMGWRCVTSFPLGSVVLIFCARTPAKASLLPSVLNMKGVPLYAGVDRTGLDMSQALRNMNVFVLSTVHKSLKLNAFMICWYLCFFVPAGIRT